MEPDEEYLVEQIKKSSETDLYRSRTWVITAKSLFPKNFNIQFEAYLIEKRNDNAKEAAGYLSSIFQTFDTEKKLWEEIFAITNALKTDCTIQSDMLLKKIFSSLAPEIQHNILTATAEKCDDTMEHCRLILLLSSKFPQNTDNLINKLVEILTTTEKHDSDVDSVLNCYRKTLVCEVLPLLFESKSDIPHKQLQRYIQKSIEFYMTYLMASPKTMENFLKQNPKTDVSWESMFALLNKFGVKLNWPLLCIFSTGWKPEQIWNQISKFRSTNDSNDANLDSRQLIYCSTVLFLYCIYQYTKIIRPYVDNRLPVVLVEAFTDKDFVDNCIKKMKLKQTPHNALPNFSTGDGINDVVKYFHYSLLCWNIFSENKTHDEEFKKIKQQMKLDAWINDFMIDKALYYKNIEEYKTLVSDSNDMRSLLWNMNIHYIEKNYKALEIVISRISEQFEFLPSPPIRSSANLVEKDASRLLYFLPISKITILEYLVKLVTILYWNKLQSILYSNGSSDIELDKVYGCLLIVCQMNWPQEKNIVLQILSQIRERKCFVFPIFYKYITHVEILEEFMYMYTNKPDIKLVLTEAEYSSNIRTDIECKNFREQMKKTLCQPLQLHVLLQNFLNEKHFVYQL